MAVDAAFEVDAKLEINSVYLSHDILHLMNTGTLENRAKMSI